MRKGIILAIALCAAISYPTMARAAEINYLESFNSGIETLKGKEVDETDTHDSNSQVRPEQNVEHLLAVDGEKAGEKSNSYWNQIVRVLYAMALTFNGNRYFLTFDGHTAGNYYRGLRDLLLIAVPIAVLLVFAWWGVRKCLRIIMSAFRKGKANV